MLLDFYISFFFVLSSALYSEPFAVIVIESVFVMSQCDIITSMISLEPLSSWRERVYF